MLLLNIIALFLQLLAAHQHEVDEALEKIDADRNRQHANLRAKLAEKKKKKLEALQRKQENEMSRELLEQKKEFDEVRNEQVIVCHFPSFHPSSFLSFFRHH